MPATSSQTTIPAKLVIPLPNRPWSIGGVLFFCACLLNPFKAEASGLLLAPRFAAALDPAPDDALVAILTGLEFESLSGTGAAFAQVKGVMAKRIRSI